MADTIYALSSGTPPAGVAIVRISGPAADHALTALSGQALPGVREARLRELLWNGVALDHALVLRFAGPASATGEDMVELHLHGGRATIAAVYQALHAQPGLRLAEPGEFTRRAFENGRIDLFAAEALSDLLRAETEGQRRSALKHVSGGLRSIVEELRVDLLDASARVEAAIEFAEEDDVVPWPERGATLAALSKRVRSHLDAPPAERLHDGLKVVIGGPPNSGKSTLLNALVGRDAAIVSPIAGTTRDAIEVAVQLHGIPFVFVDTAGLRDDTEDAIEAIGIRRARDWFDSADIVIWLDEDKPAPGVSARVLCVQAKCDIRKHQDERMAVSAVTRAGLDSLIAELVRLGQDLLPAEDTITLNHRQRELLREVRDELDCAALDDDLLIVAEHLRHARGAIDRLSGRAGTEEMLDALFSAFCIGK